MEVFIESRKYFLASVFIREFLVIKVDFWIDNGFTFLTKVELKEQFWKNANQFCKCSFQEVHITTADIQ